MATSKVGNWKAFCDADRVSCSLCLETFIDPQSLHCSHSFCDSCLQPLISTSAGRKRVLNCLLCRQQTKVLNNGQFPRNLALVGVIKDMTTSNVGNLKPFCDADRISCSMCLQTFIDPRSLPCGQRLSD